MDIIAYRSYYGGKNDNNLLFLCIWKYLLSNAQFQE